MSETLARWTHRGFAAFQQGEFDNGGDNLYVTRAGAIEWIHRTDVNGDGHVDLVFPNSHGYDERGPTWIYTQPPPAAGEWGRRELPNDSGWMSQAADVDGDGFLDLIVVNAENGVASELDCYVYWGGPDGLTGARSELPTAGAYDVAAVDLTGNGLLDLILPSAWVDHHNAGEPRPLHVYLQTRPRVFEDATDRFAIPGVADLAVACEDLDGDGELELVVANYRAGFEHDTDSFIYRRRGSGFAVETPLRLPTHYAMQVVLADLDGDGGKEVVFAGGDQVQIYWNRDGHISAAERTILPVAGNWTMFAEGAVRVAVADVDGDGRDELLIVNKEGVQIRSADALHQVRESLPVANASWLHATDLDGDGRLDLIVSRYEDGRSYDTRSLVFWNGADGFSAQRTTALATGGAMGCTVADLDGDGRPEVVFNNTMAGPSQNDPGVPGVRLPGRAGRALRPGTAPRAAHRRQQHLRRRQPRSGRSCRPGVHRPRRTARVPRRTGRPASRALHPPASAGPEHPLRAGRGLRPRRLARPAGRGVHLRPQARHHGRLLGDLPRFGAGLFQRTEQRAAHLHQGQRAGGGPDRQRLARRDLL